MAKKNVGSFTLNRIFMLLLLLFLFSEEVCVGNVYCNLTMLRNLTHVQELWMKYFIRKFLPRSATNNEIQSIGNQLDSGLSHYQVARPFSESEERYRFVVNTYYSTFLNRAPSESDRDYWVQLFVSGSDERTIIKGFLTSTEYVQQANGDHRVLLTLLYRNLLNRTDTTQDQQFFLPMLQQPNGIHLVADAILYDRHPIPKYTEHRIRNAYTKFLNRTPSAGEIDNWLPIAQSPHGLKELWLQLASSSEFIDKYLASQAIQRCINAAAPGDKIFLAPAGTYLIDRKILLNKSNMTLGTIGLDQNSTTCDPSRNDVCVRLKASKNYGSYIGLIDSQGFNVSHVTIQNLIFDGNRQERSTRPEAAHHCEPVNEIKNWRGFNVHLHSISHLTFIKNASINALCGTSTFIWGDDAVIENNLFADNGARISYRVSDGLTIGNMNNGIVRNNQFTNNTDVNLIFGGCRSCDISYNIIDQTSEGTGGSFVGLMLQLWPEGTPGLYGGSDVHHNQITANPIGDLGRMGVGIQIGQNAWYLGETDGEGCKVRDNTITNANHGFVIDSAKNFEVYDNTVLGTEWGLSFNTACAPNSPAISYSIDLGLPPDVLPTTSNINFYNNFEGPNSSSLVGASVLNYLFGLGCWPNAWW